MRIQRIKTGQGGPDGLPPSTATHWAVRVDGSGQVVAWSRDPAAAADLDEPTAHKVLAHYASRPAAGRLSIDGEAPEEVPSSATPDLAALREAVDEIHRQREVIAGLREQLEQQAAEIAALREAPPAEVPAQPEAPEPPVPEHRAARRAGRSKHEE